ncbi:MAG: transcription antitermination factor NusB [Candidatus Neomarinimicrobiota bacterium]
MTVVSKRRLGRELVLQALYAYEFTRESPDQILADLEGFRDLDPKMQEFVLRLLNKTVEYQEWGKNEIVRRLENWDYDRVALIDRLILQMMIVEMVFLDDIPPKVSITEGVEIAKKYSTAESGAFINGILDSVFHALDSLSQPVR